MHCLEEGLANALALIETEKKMHNDAVDAALTKIVSASPPGYDQGGVIRPNYADIRCSFAEENQHACLPHFPKRSPDIWYTAPYMFNVIANIKSRVNYVIQRSSPLVKRLPFRPLLPPNKLIKKLIQVAGLIFVRSGGNHDIYRTPTGKIIPLPRHPRDLGKGLVRQILREAGLNVGLEQFMQM